LHFGGTARLAEGSKVIREADDVLEDHCVAIRTTTTKNKQQETAPRGMTFYALSCVETNTNERRAAKRKK
jgi:hypothetical protein